MRHFSICVSVVFLLLSNAVALPNHCRSSFSLHGTCYSACPLVGHHGEMTHPQQQEAAEYREKADRHSHLQQYHEKVGDLAKATAGIQLDMAHLTNNLNKKSELSAAVHHNTNEASRHYGSAQYHKDQATHYRQLAFGRRR